MTLPHEAGKTTVYVGAKNQNETLSPVAINWDAGFRPGAVKDVKRLEAPGQRTRFQLTDEAGRSATLSGPIEPAVTAGEVVISATFPEATPKSTGTLTGTVLDQDGRPIADANVTIYFAFRQGGAISAQDEHRVRTDAQGRYVLRSVPRKSSEGDPTKLSVVVYKDGYAGVDSRLTGVIERANVFQPGDDGTQVVESIRLQPGISLSGTVLDVEGRPVVGALVETAGSWSQGNRSYRSGPNGRFTIPNLSKGVIRIAFTFGKLTELRNYVVDGKGEELKVRLHAPPAAKASGRRGKDRATYAPWRSDSLPRSGTSETGLTARLELWLISGARSSYSISGGSGAIRASVACPASSDSSRSTSRAESSSCRSTRQRKRSTRSIASST